MYAVDTAGNEALHWLLTANNKQTYELRIELTHFNGTSRFAKYSEFKIASEVLKYKLISVGQYTGTAGMCVRCIVEHTYPLLV